MPLPYNLFENGQQVRVVSTPTDLGSGGAEGQVALTLDPLGIYAWTAADGWQPLATLEGATPPALGNHNLFSISHPDVNPSDTPADSEVLTYDAAASQWKSAPAFPTGLVLPFAPSVTPTGWLLCDGSAVSRTAYTDLFSAIGTTYGTGNGTTTFNLPDLRGRAPIGAGTGDAPSATAHPLGQKMGEEAHTLTVAEMPAHTHSISAGKYGAQNNISGGGSIAAGLGTQDPVASSTGGGGAHNNVQPSLAINFIIKT